LQRLRLGGWSAEISTPQYHWLVVSASSWTGQADGAKDHRGSLHREWRRKEGTQKKEEKV
jgi:hypothetical protein